MESKNEHLKETGQEVQVQNMDNANKYMKKVISGVVGAIIILLLLMLIYSVAEFSILVVRGFINFNGAFNLSLEPVDKNRLFFTQIQGLISAALLLTILIEFIQSLYAYLKSENTNYVRIISEIALIAIVRHILTIDIEHAQPGVLIGLTTLIFVLGLIFIVLNRSFPFNQKILNSRTKI